MPDELTDAQHGEQVRARLAAATPGPWGKHRDEDWPVVGVNRNDGGEPIVSFGSEIEPDAELIANAPADLARLLARAEAAEDALAVAWQEGRESLAQDFLKPTSLDGFRPSTPNPYA